MERHNSVVVAVFSTSSGIGKTLTAINLAAGFAREGYHACLVDLDLQFGDVMSYLNLSSKLTLYDAQKDILEHPDDFEIMEYLTEYRWGNVAFSVLPPPHHVEQAYRIDVAGVEQIVHRLACFNFIILDLTSAFSALNLSMLDLSTVINYIGVIDFLPAIKNYRIGYDTLLRFQYETSKIRLIENRSGSQKFIRVEDVEKLLGGKFYHQLPNDFASASAAIRMGQPLMFSAPFSDLEQSYRKLVMRYMDRPMADLSRTASNAKPRLFSRFMEKIRNMA